MPVRSLRCPSSSVLNRPTPHTVNSGGFAPAPPPPLSCPACRRGLASALRALRRRIRSDREDVEVHDLRRLRPDLPPARVREGRWIGGVRGNNDMSHGPWSMVVLFGSGAVEFFPSVLSKKMVLRRSFIFLIFLFVQKAPSWECLRGHPRTKASSGNRTYHQQACHLPWRPNTP